MKLYYNKTGISLVKKGEYKNMINYIGVAADPYESYPMVVVYAKNKKEAKDIVYKYMDSEYLRKSDISIYRFEDLIKNGENIAEIPLA